ncbi:hypothetical protein KFU94_48340 [Chloroflexi bacterium TSY]|nr:hypothetical protein [Chloroflexi bacterium TSY]
METTPDSGMTQTIEPAMLAQVRNRICFTATDLTTIEARLERAKAIAQKEPTAFKARLPNYIRYKGSST